MNLSLNESMVNYSSFFAYEDCNPRSNPKELFSDTFKWCIILTYSFILVFGLMGNTLTCMVVFIHKSMRRSIHCYMLNLAIADIIILLLYVPSQSVLVYNQLEWTMGKSACSFFTFVIPAFLSGSIATLMAISMDRYSGVRDPFTWRVKSRRNSKIVIPVIWVFSISLSIPYYLYGGLQRSKLDGCKCLWPTSKFKISYITAMMAIQFILPFILITCVYIHIVWILSRSRESINRLHKRMVKMVIFLLFTYLICVGTQYFEFYYQMVLLDSQDTNSGPYIYVISNLLLTVQAAVNPIIYSSTRDDFHLAFKTFIVNCHYKVTNLLLDDRYLDEEDCVTETDTERWFNIDTGRRGSSGSFVRKKSVESNSGRRLSSVEIPAIHVRKASEVSLRKASVHSMRRKSSTRAPPLPFIIDSDSIGSCSDYEEGEEPSLRSYRLGTLEFLDLEEFHQKRKLNGNKESAVQKISNAVRKLSRNLSHTLFHTDIDGCETNPSSLSTDECDSIKENFIESHFKKSRNLVVNSLHNDDDLDSQNSSVSGLVMKIDENRIDDHCENEVANRYQKLSNENHDENINTRKISIENQLGKHHPDKEKKRSRKLGITDLDVKMISSEHKNHVASSPSGVHRENHSHLHNKQHQNQNKTLSPKRKYSASLFFRATIHRKLSRSLEDISALTKANFQRRPSHVALPGKSALKSSDPAERRRKASKSIRWEDTELKNTVHAVVYKMVESVEMLEKNVDVSNSCHIETVDSELSSETSHYIRENNQSPNIHEMEKSLKTQNQNFDDNNNQPVRCFYDQYPDNVFGGVIKKIKDSDSIVDYFVPAIYDGLECLHVFGPPGPLRDTKIRNSLIDAQESEV